MWEKRKPKEPAYICPGLENVGAVYFRTNQFDEASKYFERSLTFAETYKRDTRRIAKVCLDLGNVRLKQRRFAEAEAFLNRTIQSLQPYPEFDDSILGQAWNALAQVHFQQQKWPQAEPCFREAIRLLEPIFGSELPAVINLYQGLAVVQCEQEKWDDAEQALLQALAKTEKGHGKDNPLFVLGLKNLSAVYGRQNKPDQLDRLIQQAISIIESAVGPNDVRVAELLEHHAVMLRSFHRSAEAHSLEQRAKKIRAQAKSPNTENT